MISFVKIDTKDKAIIKLLEKEPNITHQKIANKLKDKGHKLSRQSVQKRVKNLETHGVIRQAVLKNDKLLGKEITAFILIELGSTHDIQLDVHKVLLSRIDELELEEIHYVAGHEDILTKMRTKTIDTLRVNLVKLMEIEGVARTRTIISLARFERIFPNTSEEFLNALEIIGTER